MGGVENRGLRTGLNTSHGTWRMLMHEKPCLIPILNSQLTNQPCLIYCQQYFSTPWDSTSSKGPHYGEWRKEKITSIEVTFRKTTHQRFDKKGAESRRRPTARLASSLTSPHQLDNLQDRRQLAEQRRIRIGRRHHHRRRHYTITLPHYKTTATITASPTIYRLAPTLSPEAPPKRNQGPLHRPETSPNRRLDIFTSRSRSHTLAWGLWVRVLEVRRSHHQGDQDRSTRWDN